MKLFMKSLEAKEFAWDVMKGQGRKIQQNLSGMIDGRKMKLFLMWKTDSFV
jgi:hypothetical protein